MEKIKDLEKAKRITSQLNAIEDMPKMSIWVCDKCGEKDVLCIYSSRQGWYCRDCITDVYNKLKEKIELINMVWKKINE